MSINDLPEDVVKHEIMTYLKPKYKVVEVTYLQITTKIDYSEGEMELDTTQNVRTGLFKIQKTLSSHEFNPYNCYMTPLMLGRIEEMKDKEDKTFHKEREQYFHGTFIYISHTLVCS